MKKMSKGPKKTGKLKLKGDMYSDGKKGNIRKK